MSSQTPPSNTQPPSQPENLSRAFELYWQAKGLSQFVNSPDRQTAQALIRVADDAIKEFGNTNQDKKIELERIKEEAEDAVPAKDFKEFKSRVERYILRKITPRNPKFRSMLLIIFSLALLVPTSIPYWDYFQTPPESGTPPSIDPLQIIGKWNYTTTFRDKKPKGPDGAELQAVMGFNKIDPSGDRIGYRMDGARTHYLNVGSVNYTYYKLPMKITLSRVGYSPDSNSFYFHFVVERDGKKGFVEMFLNLRSATKITGEVYYLHTDETWTTADITFEKTESAQIPLKFQTP
jgi:hypothetical protein